MALLRNLVLDLYSPLAHKQDIGPGDRTNSSLAPTWVPPTDLRRLAAYKLRKAYLANVARYMASTEMQVITTDNDGLRISRSETVDNLDDRREYGDAALLVDRVQAGVLGDSFEIVVDGADQDLPDEPPLPDEPELGENPTEVQRRIHAIRQQLWAATVESVLTQWERDWTEQPGLRARQEWLRDWADTELFPAKKVECEQDICGLADGVYVLSLGDGRPYVDVYDPGFYFPVLTDTTRGFPTKVHLAWEYDETIDGRTTKWVRRLTWQLGPIMPRLDDAGNSIGFLDPVTGPDGRALITDRIANPEEQKRLRLFPGQIVRDYPWNFDDDGKQQASAETCYFTDGRWRFDDLQARKVDDFTEDQGIFRILDDGQIARRLDLRHDFLPLIHTPNTPASREHFGQSVLDLVLQLLDDIQIGDTDIQDAAALAAGPAIGLSGEKTSTELRVKPGTVYNLGPNGRMDVLDLSQGLAELRNIQDSRLERLSINSRIPAEVLGRDRKDGNAASSGRHEEIRLGPFTQLIGKLRMTREPKDILLLKFTQRLAQLGGWLPPGRNPVARIAYGSFVPSDRKSLIEEVTVLLKAHAISTQTAVELLVAGGLPVEDARGEVDRIRADDTASAKELADATGSEILAAQRLGLELPEREAAPRSTVLPPTPVPPLPTPPAPE